MILWYVPAVPVIFWRTSVSLIRAYLFLVYVIHDNFLCMAWRLYTYILMKYREIRIDALSNLSGICFSEVMYLLETNNNFIVNLIKMIVLFCFSLAIDYLFIKSTIILLILL